MKTIAFIFIFTLINLSAILGKSFEIAGQIKDNTNNQAIVFCYVHVYNKSDSMITTCVTDDKGFFKLFLESGEYKFTFEQMGYITDTTKFFNISENKFIGVYKLSPDVKMLDEVKITEDATTNYIDKDEQIITSNLKQGSATTYDVLGKVQGLSYDRYNDQITVDNDNNIIILVNGVEKDANYVKNIEPKRMKKVEIIRSPSGKYALEGYSAVLNIILKSNYKGTDFNYNGTSICFFFQDVAPKYPVNNGNLNFNYTNRKLNVYGNYFYNINDVLIRHERKQIYNDSSKISYLLPEGQEVNYINDSKTHYFTFGSDFYISPKQTLSYEGNYNFSPYNGNHSFGEYNVVLENDISTENFRHTFEEKNQSKTLNNSLFYIVEFDNRNKLNASYTFSNYKEIEQTTITQRTEEKSFEENNSQNYSKFDLMFTHSFNKKLKIELGYGNIWRVLDNNFDPDIKNNENKLENFRYKNLRNNIYTYGYYKISDKLNFKTGLAAETSIIENKNFKNNYLILMPYFDFKYKPADVFDITLKYRSNSDYPSISQTNPFTNYNDWQMAASGNPELKPENNNTISLRMNILGGAINAEPYFSFSENRILNLITQTDEGLWQSTYVNGGKYRQFGLRASLTFPVGKSFAIQSSIDFNKEKILYNGKSHSLTDYPMTHRLIYQNSNTKTMAGVLYQKQLRKYITWHGYHSNNNDFWSLMIQQPFFKNRLNLTILYVLPVDFGMCYDQGSYTNTNAYEEFNEVDLSLVKNMLIFQLRFRFATGKEVKRINKNIDIETNDSGGGFM